MSWTLYVERCGNGYSGRLFDDGVTWERQAPTTWELVEKFAVYIVGCRVDQIRVVRC